MKFWKWWALKPHPPMEWLFLWSGWYLYTFWNLICSKCVHPSKKSYQTISYQICRKKPKKKVSGNRHRRPEIGIWIFYTVFQWEYAKKWKIGQVKHILLYFKNKSILSTFCFINWCRTYFFIIILIYSVILSFI